MSATWSDWRTARRMGLPATMPATPAPTLAQPSRPGPTMASDWQRRKAAELGTTIPALATQGQAAAIIKAAMAPKPLDAFDTEWAASMAAIPNVTPQGRWAQESHGIGS